MTATGHWIALCLHDMSNNYQRMMWDDAKKVAPRHNHTVSVYSADRNGDRQLEQIRTILDLPANRRPAAILVNPVRENMLLGVAKEAVGKGIAWVYLCRWTDSINDLRRAHPRVPVFSISPNQHSVGQIQGLQLRLLLRPGDELVYIQGPSGVSTSQRRLMAARPRRTHKHQVVDLQ
jgi:ABC-type sugar transport system substrate-binding protein